MLSQLHLAVSSSDILKFKHFSAGKHIGPVEVMLCLCLGCFSQRGCCRHLVSGGQDGAKQSTKHRAAPMENSLPPSPTSRVLRLGVTVFGGVGFTLLPHVLWPHPHEGHSILNPLDTAHISIYSLESLFSGCLGDRALVFSTAILGAPPSPCLVPSAASFFFFKSI